MNPASISAGRLSLVLHAHLPAARHILRAEATALDPADPVCRWFWEALVGVYLPLLGVLRDTSAPLTLSLSPPLLEMLRDEQLAEGFEPFLATLLDGRVEPEFAVAVRSQRARLERARQLWRDVDRDVVGALGEVASAGGLELGVCAGMHAILPLVVHPEIRSLHLRWAASQFEEAFGRQPRFLWLPECGYTPGLEAQIAAAGFWATVVEATAISSATSSPVFGNFAPLVTGDVAFFGRDTESAESVWSATSGYPGDPVYREFHRAHASGLKPWRITGSEPREPWDEQAAIARAREHAREFVADRRAQFAAAAASVDRPLHLTAAYDAELFGHWWYEGPDFLRAVLELAAAEPAIQLTTPLQFLDEVRVHQSATPAPSTWGREADFSWWVDEATEWIYPVTGAVELELLERRQRGEGVDGRLIELMQAQCSDWPFAIRNVGFAEYAKSRIQEHVKAARRDLVGE